MLTIKLLMHEKTCKSIKSIKRNQCDLHNVTDTINACKESLESFSFLVSDFDQKKILAEVQDDRRFELDAAIIRIMKSRREMEHVELISEVSAKMLITLHHL